MKNDYGLKLAQEMYPSIRPLPWPENQPIAQIDKNAEGKYSVFLFGVTQTYVTKGGLRLLSKEENRYAYNADLITGTHLFDTLNDADFAYMSYCKLNERMIGYEHFDEDDNQVGVVKKYLHRNPKQSTKELKN